MTSFEFSRFLYQLELNEAMQLDSGRQRIVRVPGGWIYQLDGKLCFVPFSNEFKYATNKSLDTSGISGDLSDEQWRVSTGGGLPQE